MTIAADDLEELAPLMMAHIERQIAERRITGDAVTGLSFTRAAMMRAALYFRRFVSSDDEHAEGAGQAFGLTWMLAERETMQRVMTAISSPAAKGREADVIATLMKGASIEEALAMTNSAPAALVTQEGRVVAFPARRVTDSADDETRASAAVSRLGSRTEQEDGRNDC
ncbi:hypothetical protein [Shinella pollutisoli]|uniref:Uncharacterized protein n=1 Tax=Shinella pollutisoli TaxID=2250594 RepID=A0ABV7DIU5_9HYPH|nr:hypothetical protein [Shinella pollutisoli]